MKKFKSQVLPAIGVVSLLTLLGPSLVLLNTPDQEIPLDVWIYLLIIFLGTSLLIIIIIIISKKWAKVNLEIVFKSIFLAIFLKIIYDYAGIAGIIGPDDGAPKIKDFSLAIQIEAVLIFLILFLFSFILFKRYRTIASQFFWACLCISLITPLYVFISYQYIQGGNNDQNYKFNYSKNKNIIIIYADMLQGSTSGTYFKKNPAVLSELDGFTIYPNAVSPFPFTNFSMPAFLTGKNYAKSSENNFKENLRYAQEDSLITDAMKKGFKPQVLGLKNLQLYLGQKNLYNGFSGTQLSFSLIKSTLKRIFKLNLNFSSASENQQMIGLKKTSLEVMDSMENGNLIESKPIITVVHNFIPHTPIFSPNTSSSSDELSDREKDFNPENYYLELGFFYNKLNKLFKRLKEMDVYDNSLIIVFGDHGHFIGRNLSLYKFPIEKNELPGYEIGPWERTISMYNPLVMIKPPLSNSKPIISNFGMNIINLREVVNEFINGNKILLDKYSDKNQEIIVFKEAKKNPYFFTQDHKLIKFNGNINDLVYRYTTPNNLQEYKIGSILAPANDVLFGKWVKENEGAWLQEQRSRSVFLIKDSLNSKDIILSLKVTPLISNLYKYQDVELLINGKSIGIQRFTRPEQDVKINIPYSIYKDEKNIFRLEFIPINPISPKSIGLWNESNLLSVYIHSLSLSKALNEAD